jgi:hypothetical protein
MLMSSQFQRSYFTARHREVEILAQIRIDPCRYDSDDAIAHVQQWTSAVAVRGWSSGLNPFLIFRASTEPEPAIHRIIAR